MADRLLRLENVVELVGFKSSKIYALIASGDFPSPIKIGNASRWPESKIDAWIAERVAQASRTIEA